MAETNNTTHIAIVPSPGMGHLIPFVALAQRLVEHHHSFTVTLIIATDSSPTKAQISVLNSLPSSILSIHLPPADLSDVPSTARIETRISLTMTRSNPALRDLFGTLASQERLPSVIIVDMFGTDAFDVAAEFHVSPYVFFASNANLLSFFLHLPTLHETVSCEFRYLTEPVKLRGCVPIPGKDLIDTVQDRKDDAYKWLLHNTKRYKEAKGILVNSFVDLEMDAIKALREPPAPEKPSIYPLSASAAFLLLPFLSLSLASLFLSLFWAHILLLNSSSSLFSSLIMSQDSTAERTTVFNTQAPHTTLLSVNMSSVTKLNSQNYLMWCRQVKALLSAHELHHFLEDSTHKPPSQLTVNGTTSDNPAYAAWCRQDQLLYSSLIGAITLPVQSVVSTATTAQEVWDLLAQTFGQSSRGHIRQLKLQIRACVKGTQSVSEYFRSIKSKCDELALLGKPMDAEDIIEQVLLGLGDEYRPVIDAVNARDTIISFADLHERLLNHESVLLASMSSSSQPVVANVADVRSKPQSRGNNGGNNTGGGYNRSHSQQRGGYNSNSQNSGSRHNNNSHNNTRGGYQGKCQICSEFGHSARFCPQFRYARGPPAPSSWQPSAPPSWSQPAHMSSWPKANAASFSDSSTWLLDSGASHHMTSDLSNLASHHPYNGGEDVMIGDGSALSITHTGEGSSNRDSSSGRQAGKWHL